jgi:hypothetical protein
LRELQYMRILWLVEQYRGPFELKYLGNKSHGPFLLGQASLRAQDAEPPRDFDSGQKGMEPSNGLELDDREYES